MSPRLQFIIIICMLIALIYIGRRVAQRKLDFRFGIGWSLVVIVIMIFAIWPVLLQKTSMLLGIYDPVNMLAFLGLILAIFAIFSLMMEVSKQGEQIKKLTQELAILRKDTKKSPKKTNKNSASRSDSKSNTSSKVSDSFEKGIGLHENEKDN
ncbi:MAG: DUF2304 domain-containing protein [Eubacterium sp.]|nr:DUF2304 domain-containing protein [Eubacterium sp.]